MNAGFTLRFNPFLSAVPAVSAFFVVRIFGVTLADFERRV
jgi:hypothetical protein